MSERSKSLVVMAQHNIMLEDGTMAWTAPIKTKLIGLPSEKRPIIHVPSAEGGETFLIITDQVENGQRVICGPRRCDPQPTRVPGGPWQPDEFESDGTPRLRLSETDFQAFMDALRWARYPTPQTAAPIAEA